MAVRQYIGMRYLTKFADPIEWDDTRQYEHMTVVQYQGGTYVSKQMVPIGIPITDTNYWLYWADFNAQIEQYRQEVRAFDGRITQAQGDASDALTAADYAQDTADTAIGILAGYGEGETVEADITTLQNEIDALDTKMGTLPEGETSVVGYVDGKVQEINTDLTDVDTTLAGFSPSVPVKPYVDAAVAQQQGNEMVIIGDSFSTDFYVSEEALWYNIVSGALGCNPHAYAERAAGFSKAGEHGNTFASLLSMAVSDTSFDNTQVRYVFIYGGLNDITYNTVPAAFTTACPALCASAREAFPNALIVLCGINAWGTGLTVSAGNNNRGQIYYEHLMRSQVSTMGTGVSFISMCMALGFNTSFYGNGNHPNADGQKVIAAWILSHMFGSGMTHTKTGNLVTTEDTTGGNFAFYLSAGRIDFNMLVQTTGADQYMSDGLNIFKEGYTSFVGTPLVSSLDGGQTINVGYIGTKDTDGNLHFVKQGYGRSFISW